MLDTATVALLADVCTRYPAIDNHAHPLLSETHRASVPFESLVSEADAAALPDAAHTLASFRATKDLADLYQLKDDTSSPATWEALKTARNAIPYDELCRRSFGPAHIQCLLLDDGLGGVEEMCEGYKWHDQFTSSPTKRIVRVEVVAQDLLQGIFAEFRGVPSHDNFQDALNVAALFKRVLASTLTSSAGDPEVVAFKSVACYRTGLAISTSCTEEELASALVDVYIRYQTNTKLRIADKALNDYIVRATLEIAGMHSKPVQFHTGLGDADITLALSSPAHLQAAIKAYPSTTFVLLHSSYPYTRDAGYLTSVYANVYLDFGEIFPFVSADGQEAVLRQVLELAPTNKIMWSTDGHWWPESYYLGTIQARRALFNILHEYVTKGHISASQAIGIAKNALFHNANRVYTLGLSADFQTEYSR
ncbi:hypothetical protein DENSPDRAFT_842547 [Dentipellis sp. KUC8613]|nr:hypothetical protein DENSPDRAFT_842547 [Dentipellis sp. KUC8613]